MRIRSKLLRKPVSILIPSYNDSETVEEVHTVMKMQPTASAAKEKGIDGEQPEAERVENPLGSQSSNTERSGSQPLSGVSSPSAQSETNRSQRSSLSSPQLSRASPSRQSNSETQSVTGENSPPEPLSPL